MTIRDRSAGSTPDLGMARPIARRDFLQGAAITLGLGLAPDLLRAATAKAPQDLPGYYPPALTGMRGSHPGSFEAAHALRDNPAAFAKPIDVPERYDLIVVGAGISGLAAAHFYRARQKKPVRILILDNHDDFGGHAKRNEFALDGGIQLLNGGTLGIESPTPYSKVADGLLQSLGIFPAQLAAKCNDPKLYPSLGLKQAIFFDRETFGEDKLVPRPTGQPLPTVADMQAFLEQTPLSESVRRDILAIETATIDPMPGLSSAEKKDRLAQISYQDYLLTILKADPGVVDYYRRRTDGLWACGIDAVSALDCWGSRLPGFQGLNLDRGATDRMGYTPKGYVATGGSYEFHFPDGNASIARLLVRSLIPGAIGGSTAEDSVTARTDYSKLDRPGEIIRLRLSSTVTRVRNRRTATGVEVSYARQGKLYRVTAKHCVLACWNATIPHLCPELPQLQKQALHSLVKSPLVYVSVALRHWRAFQAAGVSAVHCPGSYFSGFRLNAAVNIGDYVSPKSPDQPILITMTRTPASPGLSEIEQHKVGRAELLDTPFETFEYHIRSQLGRALGPYSFDPAEDITAITVNRWPHGYAPEFNSLWDGDDFEASLVTARRRFGAIAIANSDCGGGAYSNVAIDQADRAVNELLSLA